MFIFRADANPSIGMGHIMRCLSIADAAVNKGQRVLFILADDSVAEYVSKRGYAYRILHSDYTAMENELDLWPEDINGDKIIVDSYFVTYNYFVKIKQRFSESILVYLDDVASFAYPVDVLINYNSYSDNIDYQGIYNTSGEKTPNLILGVKYTPLRTMFEGIEQRACSNDIKNILISTGGSDEMHVALRFIMYITSILEKSDCRYHFLVGAMNRDIHEIKRVANSREFIIIHEDVTDMKSLIQSMDICVSAAGSTLYEICACGVPLITYSIADNQITGAKAFARMGLALNLGDLRDASTIMPNAGLSCKLRKDAMKNMFHTLKLLCDNCEKRIEMSKKMQMLVDGKGAQRLVEILNNYTIECA